MNHFMSTSLGLRVMALGVAGATAFAVLPATTRGAGSSGKSAAEARMEIAKLQSPEPRLRADAIMKLRYIGMNGGGTEAIPHLLKLLGDDTQFPQMLLWSSSLSALTESCSDHDTLGSEAAETLARIGRTSDELLALLKHADWRQRADAARALGGVKDLRATEKLAALLAQTEERPEVRGNAALALGLMKAEQGLAPLLAAVKDREAMVRAAAASALGRFPLPLVVPPLTAALRDDERKVRLKAAGSLGQSASALAVPPLIRALGEDRDKQVREVAAAALGSLKDRRAAGALINALTDDYVNVQINAARALGAMRESAALAPLLINLRSRESAVRGAAALALGELGERQAIPALITAVKTELAVDGTTLECELRALTTLGHAGAKQALEICRTHPKDWKEWWAANKEPLLQP
jgi:HEAT repeat protein